MRKPPKEVISISLEKELIKRLQYLKRNKQIGSISAHVNKILTDHLFSTITLEKQTFELLEKAKNDPNKTMEEYFQQLARKELNARNQ